MIASLLSIKIPWSHAMHFQKLGNSLKSALQFGLQPLMISNHHRYAQLVTHETLPCSCLAKRKTTNSFNKYFFKNRHFGSVITDFCRQPHRHSLKKKKKRPARTITTKCCHFDYVRNDVRAVGDLQKRAPHSLYLSLAILIQLVVIFV